MSSTSPHTAWFSHDRFGLFVHWGLYSIPARQGGNGLVEWIRHNERLTDEQYDAYFRTFDPDLFDPSSWARAARQAGMRYAVLTTKHHDGFCLFDSALTEFKATNTSAKRDLVREFVEAFRAEGLRIGFYYSLIDWHHEDFPLDGLHPQRDDLAFREANAGRDLSGYVAYLHAQVRELLTHYGEISVLWFDFSYPQLDWGWSRGKGPDEWRAQELLRLVYDLQPNILVNNRLGTDGDFVTPEEALPLAWPEVNGVPAVWEACQTLNGTWGYARDNHDWKDAGHLVRLLVEAVSKGGNLLLNVGPNARGEWPLETSEVLREVGLWMRLHESAVRGATAYDAVPPPDARFTCRGHRVYLHLFAWPLGEVHLAGFAGRVGFARFLHDGSEVVREERGEVSEHDHLKTSVPPRTLTLKLPSRRPEVLIPVVELTLKPTEDRP